MHNQTSSNPVFGQYATTMRHAPVTTLHSFNQADEPVRESALKKQVGAGVGNHRSSQSSLRLHRPSSIGAKGLAGLSVASPDG